MENPKQVSALSADEVKWLLGLLENMQLNGTAEQVRALLHMRDGVYAKLMRQKDTGENGGGKEGE